MMSNSRRPLDIETIPPPAKRVKSVEEELLKSAATPVSPEKEATVASIMRKRFHSSSSPTEQRNAKRMKQTEPHSPTTTSTQQQEPKVDANVFASAFALASLALSPQQQRGAPPPLSSPNNNHESSFQQTREDDTGRDSGDYSSLREPSSPYRVGMDGAMPISPAAGSAALARRRVKFARRITSMRSIPGRAVHPYDRMGRMVLGAHGAAAPSFRHDARQAYPSFAAAQQQQQQQPWMPPMNHHPSMPPPPPREQDWICDYCHVASFVSYEEACAHESTCRIACHGPTERKMHDRTATLRDEDDPSSMALYDHHRIEQQQAEEQVQEEDPTQYFEGTVALAVPSADSDWLSELNCFVRQNCVEAFSATEEDIARASKRGRIALCQVGIRCKFCVHRNNKEKAVAAVSYPTTVSGIYESVKRWQRVHQAVCQDIPQVIREKLDNLTNTCVWVPTTRQYWADSARALGMTDTCNGIRFERPPSALEWWVPSNHTESSSAVVGAGEDAGEEAGFIALPCDRDEIPEYVYFLMRQVESCRFTEADRFVARSKGPVGFAGFQCRHCNGHAGLGKYFPLTAKSLATNSTSQNIHAHLLKCRKCPPTIKEELVRLKTEKGKSPRLVPGWRREFFDRIWERMHGEQPQH